jgi:hypothetical protein
MWIERSRIAAVNVTVASSLYTFIDGKYYIYISLR